MKVLITGPFDEEIASHMATEGFDIIRHPANVSQEDLKGAIHGVEAYILGGNEKLTGEILDAADSLKMIVFLGEQFETFMAAGVKGILQDRCIVLESTPGVSTNAVAEMACSLIFSCLRRIPYMVQSVQSFSWPEITGQELAGKTLGIYGMGRIGYTVVKRLGGFDIAKVLYSDVTRSARGEEDLAAQRVELAQLFAESDVLSIHVPLSDQTKDQVGEDLLQRMKRTSVLVNTARPGIVRADALRRALQEEWFACAAFDGYYVEGAEFEGLRPEGDHYGLLAMHDRFFVTSHQAFNTVQALKNASEASAAKLSSFFGISSR